VTLQGIRQHLLDVLHVLARAAALMLQHAPCLAGMIMGAQEFERFMRSYRRSYRRSQHSSAFVAVMWISESINACDNLENVRTSAQIPKQICRFLEICAHASKEAKELLKSHQSQSGQVPEKWLNSISTFLERLSEA